MGGSRKKVTVGYKTYMSALAKWCHGPIDRITRIYLDDKIAWLGKLKANGTININNKSLFGGESSLGGAQGPVNITFGNPDQTLPGAIASRMGINAADNSANRGVLATFFDNLWWGNSPILPEPGVRVQRIHKSDYGKTQWYDAKAEVPAGVENNIEFLGEGWECIVIEFTEPNEEWSDWAIPGNDAGWNQCGQLPFATPGLSGNHAWYTRRSNIWIRRKVTIKRAGTKVKLAADNGCVLFVDGHQVGSSNPNNDNITANQNYPVEFIFEKKGTFWIHAKAYAEVKAADDGGNNVNFYLSDSLSGDMNAVHVIREAMTSTIWGMGVPESMLDDVQWRTAADTAYNERLGVSFAWDRSKPVLDMINDMLLHIDALPPQLDRRTGKIYLPLIRDDYDKNTLPIFDQSKISKVADYTIPSVSELSNTVTVKYHNLDLRKQDSVTVSDPALLTMQGSVKSQTVDLFGFVNFDTARAAAMRILRGVSKRLRACTIYTTRHGASVRVGDVIKVTWPDLGMIDAVMRVVGAHYGLDKKQEVKLNLVEDVYDFDSYAVLADIDDEEPPDLYGDPLETITKQQAFESPYWMVVMALGDVEAIENAKSYAGQGAITALGHLPMSSSALDATVLIDGEDEGSADISNVFTLDANIGKTDTTILAWSENFEEGLASLGDEIIQVVSVTDPGIDPGMLELSVVRGVLDTVPLEHLEGAVGLEFGDNSFASESLYSAGDTVNVKLLPNSAQDSLDENQAISMQVDLIGRASRPYPPANVKFDGANYPSTLSNTVNMTWAHRNRQFQSGNIYGYFSATLTPEPDLRYGVQFIDDANNILYGSQVVSGASLSFSFDYVGDLKIIFWAIDNLGESMVKQEWVVNYSGTSEDVTHATYIPTTGTIIDGGDLDA